VIVIGGVAGDGVEGELLSGVTVCALISSTGHAARISKGTTTNTVNPMPAPDWTRYVSEAGLWTNHMNPTTPSHAPPRKKQMAAYRRYSTGGRTIKPRPSAIVVGTTAAVIAHPVSMMKGTRRWRLGLRQPKSARPASQKTFHSDCDAFSI
jgi:hypothetical protein